MDTRARNARKGIAPRQFKADLAQRDAEIEQLRAGGMLLKDIALTYQISLSHVSLILRTRACREYRAERKSPFANPEPPPT